MSDTLSDRFRSLSIPSKVALITVLFWGAVAAVIISLTEWEIGSSWILSLIFSGLYVIAYVLTKVGMALHVKIREIIKKNAERNSSSGA